MIYVKTGKVPSLGRHIGSRTIERSKYYLKPRVLEVGKRMVNKFMGIKNDADKLKFLKDLNDFELNEFFSKKKKLIYTTFYKTYSSKYNSTYKKHFEEVKSGTILTDLKPEVYENNIGKYFPICNMDIDTKKVVIGIVKIVDSKTVVKTIVKDTSMFV
jgi:hypothetical protein